jgi:hypothetical protein
MTPIEIITTSMAGVALFVALLARVDSRKSAAAAEKSAAAAQQANDLMARQLELATSEQNRQAQKEAAENRPLLAWRGAGPADGWQYFEFTNQGAVMSNAKVTVDNGLEGSIEPKDVIATGQLGKLKINLSKIQQLPKTVNCSIEFSDKHDERRKMAFKLTSHAVGKYFSYPPEFA